MAPRRAQRPGDEEEEERREDQGAEQETLLPAEVVDGLREADPQSRAAALLRMQRTHGNATVQKLLRSLQTPDAARDARVQSIGARAQEPAPSGRIDKAALYRDAIETELEKAPEPGKTERELAQDVVNTVGQIFVNYQAALHMFEDEVRGGKAEAVPVHLGKIVLSEFAERDLFGPLSEIVGEVVPGLQEATLAGAGDVDEVREEERDDRDSAPAQAMRNLVIAERHRVAAQQGLLIKGQIGMLRSVEDLVRSLGHDKRTELRGETAAGHAVVNRLESAELSAGQIFKKLMDRWREAARTSGVVVVRIDEEWNVRGAHLRLARGSKLAAELLKAQSNFFDLSTLKVPRLITWEPEEFAVCEALLDQHGNVRDLRANDRGRPHLQELRERLHREGLPRTRVLSGD